MQQPGARLVCVNGAFVTGYGRRGEGADTEPAAVRLELTNYRRDGSAFRNALVVSARSLTREAERSATASGKAPSVPPTPPPSATRSACRRGTTTAARRCAPR